MSLFTKKFQRGNNVIAYEKIFQYGDNVIIHEKISARQ